MAIDIPTLLDKSDLVLPEGNVLTDPEMTIIAQLIIDKVGDEDSKEPEVFCKFLEAIATINQSKALVDAIPMSSERAANYAVTYNTSLSRDAWKDFKNNLKYVCPIFGYNKPAVLGIKINSGEIAEIFSECNC